VLATLRDQGRGGGSFSAVVLQDVRVLAIDQSFEQGSGEPKLVSVVTLEVDPAEAQRLVFAAHEGKLQLALRNAVDGGMVETRSFGAADLHGRQVEPVETEPPPPPATVAARPRVEVVEGVAVRYAP
jgi:Flp pilus assembly protein CpaB